MKINQAALFALLESKDGPVGLELQRKADAITDLARTKAEVIMHRRPAVAQAIDNIVLDGGVALIGIKDEGSMARYLAAKEAREQVWLLPSLLQGIQI